MLSPGSRVGRYIVRAQLGAGGMGEVYSADDPTLNRRVALKVVRADAHGNQHQHRFRQEALAASALNHPNILTIYELGETDNGQFIASELIDGQTLRQMLKGRPGRLPFPEVLAIAQQIAAALGAAHAAGIVHRDIKPENEMVRSDGYVKVLDFGLAKRTLSAGVDADVPTVMMTEPGMLLGTVLYMAPEQVRGLAVDARADVWAFGCVLYEMVTGQSPFLGKTTADILAAVLEREPTAPALLRSDVPQDVTAIITRALVKDPQRRVQAMDDVAYALGVAARGHGPSVGPCDSAPGDVATIGVPAASSGAAGWHRGQGRAWLARPRRAMLLGIAALALGGLVTAWRLTDPGASDVPAAPVAAVQMRTLRAWLTVQKMREGRPYQGEFDSSGQEIFENGWKFRLNASSPDRTYLYVVNEGPGPSGGTTLHVLFPAPQINRGSPELAPGVPMQSGWYVFTEHEGTERFWLIASSEPVPELEAVKGAVNPTDRGLVSDPARLVAIQDLFGRASSRRPSVEKDRDRKHTILTSPDQVLVHLMELEHR